MLPGAGVHGVVDQQVHAAPLGHHPVHGGRAGRPGRGGRPPGGGPADPSPAPAPAVASRLPGRARPPPVSESSRPSPSRRVRPVTATSHPDSARATAVALPMPRVAPVTSARLGASVRRHAEVSSRRRRRPRAPLPVRPGSAGGPAARHARRWRPRRRRPRRSPARPGTGRASAVDGGCPGPGSVDVRSRPRRRPDGWGGCRWPR